MKKKCAHSIQNLLYVWSTNENRLKLLNKLHFTLRAESVQYLILFILVHNIEFWCRRPRVGHKLFRVGFRNGSSISSANNIFFFNYRPTNQYRWKVVRSCAFQILEVVIEAQLCELNTLQNSI